MLASAAASFGELFSRLADPERLPAVIHCLGGKDRTGLSVALLLTALDVPRQVVLDDYQLSGDYRGAACAPEVVELFVGSGIARQAAEGLVGAPRWVMARALAELDETYAGIEGYLLGPGGMRSPRSGLVWSAGTPRCRTARTQAAETAHDRRAMDNP